MKQTQQHETIVSLKTQMLVESLKAFEVAAKQNALQTISVPVVKLDALFAPKQRHFQK